MTKVPVHVEHSGTEQFKQSTDRDRTVSLSNTCSFIFKPPKQRLDRHPVRGDGSSPRATCAHTSSIDTYKTEKTLYPHEFFKYCAIDGLMCTDYPLIQLGINDGRTCQHWHNFWGTKLFKIPAVRSFAAKAEQ